MKISYFSIALAGLLSTLAVDAFDLRKDTGGLAVYWGQNSLSLQTDGAVEEGELEEYCNASSPPDVILLSFHHVFTNNPQINLSKHCDKYFKNSQMLDCTSLETQIQACQQKGIKILLSMGGATGSYSFRSESVGVDYAQTVYDLFLNGNSTDAELPRPFGSAVLDGVDLDIEGGGSTGYAEFTNKLHEISSDILITAAPQCAFPDAMLGEALDNGWIDAVFIQFYNNFCNAGTENFNFNEWAEWAKSTSKNPDVKLYIGSPACEKCASTGYLGADELGKIYQDTESKYADVLGGIMLWDAGAAYHSDDGSEAIAVQLKQSVLKSSASNDNSEPAVSSNVKRAASSIRSIVGRDAHQAKHPNYQTGDPYGG
ncbi:Chitinase 2 [Coemansia sp. Benny D115]|nr:Chitinase 2 [Coemansia sp. Benny D115]